MTRIENKCQLGLWTAIYSLTTCLSFAVLVGCGMWKHAMGIVMGTLLFIMSVPAVCTAAHIVKNSNNPPMLSKLGGFIVGLPRSVTGSSYVATETSEMGSHTQESADSKRSNSILYYIRQVIAILLLVVVAVEFWARYSSKNPNWNSFTDVSPCSPSSNNCVDRLIELPGNPTNQSINTCLKSWISTVKRSHTLSSSETFFHVRVLSFMFPFPDDVAIGITTNSSIEVHSAARLGSKDFGVNKKRVDKLQKYVTDCTSN